MSETFNIDEIFEIAEQIERNGANFYRKAAKSFDDEKSKGMLLELAEMEDEHEKSFAGMRRDFAKEKKLAEAFDPEGEAALYLKAIADGYVFKVDEDPSDMLTGKERMEDILVMAIILEKDSIVFYTGIRDIVPEELGKDKMSDIIAEEMEHVTLLSGKLKSLKK